MVRLAFSLALAACLAAAAAGGIDIADLARQHARLLAQEEEAHAGPSLAVLVSFSMPPASLARLAREAAAADAVLVLNGLSNGSMQQTAELIKQADPKQAAVWQLDPRVFKLHDARAVPLFAVAVNGGSAAVRGDVPLEYALRHLAQEQGPAGAHARELLGKLAAPAQ